MENERANKNNEPLSLLPASAVSEASAASTMAIESSNIDTSETSSASPSSHSSLVDEDASPSVSLSSSSSSASSSSFDFNEVLPKRNPKRDQLKEHLGEGGGGGGGRRGVEPREERDGRPYQSDAKDVASGGGNNDDESTCKLCNSSCEMVDGSDSDRCVGRKLGPSYNYDAGDDCLRTSQSAHHDDHHDDQCLLLNDKNIKDVCQYVANNTDILHDEETIHKKSFRFPSMYMSQCPLYQVGNMLSAHNDDCRGVLNGSVSYERCERCLRKPLCEMDYFIVQQMKIFEELIGRYDCSNNYNVISAELNTGQMDDFDDDAEQHRIVASNRTCDECLVSFFSSFGTLLIYGFILILSEY